MSSQAIPVKKVVTLCFVQNKNGQILLGLKKRGFGAGRWNGFGGKIEPGETITAGAKRELLEESGVVARDISAQGMVRFIYQHANTVMEVHYFSVFAYDGEPIETDEMEPRWFSPDALPFEQMWPSDKCWMPLYLEGKSFEGEFIFADYDTVIGQSLKEVSPA